jgi:hypothetical protein
MARANPSAASVAIAAHAVYLPVALSLTPVMPCGIRDSPATEALGLARADAWHGTY